MKGKLRHSQMKEHYETLSPEDLFFKKNFAFYLFLKFIPVYCISIIFSSSLKPLLYPPASSQTHDLLKIIIVTYMYIHMNKCINTTWLVYLVLFICICCRDDHLALDSQLGQPASRPKAWY